MEYSIYFAQILTFFLFQLNDILLKIPQKNFKKSRFHEFMAFASQLVAFCVVGT